MRMQPDETLRTDAYRFIGAVDAIKRIGVTLPEVQRPGAERIVRSAVHAATVLQLDHILPDFGLALQNIRRRIPVWPFLLVAYGRNAGPPVAFLADPNFVLQGLPGILHRIQKMIARIDDDGAGFLPALILNDSISWARIRARLGLRCYATRQRQGAGYQRDECATRRVIHLIAEPRKIKGPTRRPIPPFLG